MRECRLKKGETNKEGFLKDPQYVLTAESVRELVDENTIGVVVTLGRLSFKILYYSYFML